MMTKYYLIKCPLCRSEEYESVDVSMPDGYGHLNQELLVCTKCGVVYSAKVARIELPVPEKLIPKEPVDRRYASCDFTTYAKCPTCGAMVQNCMGHYDERCNKCGQRLKWGE